MTVMLIKMLYYAYRFIILLLFARAIMSWFVRDLSHPIADFIYSFTEPILLPMRNLFDRLGINMMGLDLSFLATFIAIQFIYRLLIGFLSTLI